MTAEQFGALKLSEALQLALVDLIKLEENAEFAINMDVFCTDNRTGERQWLPDKKCYVCLAGAAMVNTLNDYSDISLGLDNPARENLMYISDIALGCENVLWWCNDLPQYMEENFVAYQENPEGFKDYVRGAIEILKENLK